MSRHRLFRNMNIEDELDDDALSDGGEGDLTPQQQAQMEESLAHVRSVVGDSITSGLSDNTIRDVLWEYYFDVEKTVQWALDEQNRIKIATERKEGWEDKNSPAVSQGGQSLYGYQHNPQSMIYDYEPNSDNLDEPEVRSRLPLIVLAQQQGYGSEGLSVAPETPYGRLSTITERTERTEPSPYWRSRQYLAPPDTSRDISSPETSYGQVIAAKEREKAQKPSRKAPSASNSGTTTPNGTPKKTPKKVAPFKASGSSTPIRAVDQQEIDMAGLNLKDEDSVKVTEVTPKMNFARENLLEEAKRAIDAEGENNKKVISIVVIGHVDAGKSTLMGRLLYELGRLDEKTRRANERGSSKAGKSSFSWAWGLDGTAEERERGITMDVALQSLSTTHRQITVLDAPGHKDFIPNMISGASQADCAVLVVDAATGEFEAGFDKGGQTREHLLLVRSLGVAQIIVAVNKLDQVNWDQSRYEEICDSLHPFLIQSGFNAFKIKFVPVGAMQGINLAALEGEDSKLLASWYKGATLVDLLDKLEPPTRDITAPLRIPVSNVFKGQGAGTSVSGRLCGGVVQVGERLRILPGDEIAVIKSIEVDDTATQWAAAGSNATLALIGVDSANLTIGSVLCPVDELVPLATTFTARIIVFDIQVPITAGSSVELFHHSRDVPATTVKLISTIDRASGEVLKANPRVLAKGASAEVLIALRSAALAGSSAPAKGIPLEPFSVNKDMGRVLLRRGGETIAAGIVMEIIG